MRNFDVEEVAEFYQQRTEDTGQVFAPEAIALVFELTNGQPWLVNALARQLVEVLTPDPTIPITIDFLLHWAWAKAKPMKRADILATMRAVLAVDCW